MAFAKHPGYDAGMSEVDSLQEKHAMLSERVAQWARQYREEGREQGLAEGQADLLIRLINRRFGPQPETTLARIRGANAGQLETWSLNFVDANDVADVFRS